MGKAGVSTVSIPSSSTCNIRGNCLWCFPRRVSSLVSHLGAIANVSFQYCTHIHFWGSTALPTTISPETQWDWSIYFGVFRRYHYCIPYCWSTHGYYVKKHYKISGQTRTRAQDASIDHPIPHLPSRTDSLCLHY